MRKAVILLVLGMVLAGMNATAMSDDNGPGHVDHNPGAPVGYEYGNDQNEPVDSGPYEQAQNGANWQDE